MEGRKRVGEGKQGERRRREKVVERKRSLNAHISESWLNSGVNGRGERRREGDFPCFDRYKAQLHYYEQRLIVC